jgi:hypothetical protein
MENNNLPENVSAGSAEKKSSRGVPVIVTLALVIASYMVGARTSLHPASAITASTDAGQACRIAVADEGATLLEAALNRSDLSKEQREAAIVAPVRAVLDRFRQQGYLVIDMSRNDDGDMTVATIPSGAIDITNELRQSVGLAPARPMPAPHVATPPAAASGAVEGGNYAPSTIPVVPANTGND